MFRVLNHPFFGGHHMAKKKSSKKTVDITFINNAGTGFADVVEMEVGTTAEELFYSMMGEEAKPADHLISINRLVAAADQVVEEGDTVVITPTNVKGSVLVSC